MDSIDFEKIVNSLPTLDVVLPLEDVHGFLSSVNPTSFEVPMGYAQGMRMATTTTILMLIFEVLSWRTVRSLLKEKPDLYLAGWLSTLFNNFFVGPISAYVAFEFASPKLDAEGQVKAFFGVLFVHSIGYYLGHRSMHTRALYWAHKFHHRFNDYVTPTAANAVSLTEYGVAYMMPFIVASLIIRPDATSLYGAVAVVAWNNILIHTPALESASSYLPGIFVGTDRHLEHQ